MREPTRLPREYASTSGLPQASTQIWMSAAFRVGARPAAGVPRAGPVAPVLPPLSELLLLHSLAADSKLFSSTCGRAGTNSLPHRPRHITSAKHI